jgi:sugar lactone lactonase YvrE
MTVDSAGRYYVSTPVGVQVFDLTCRLSGIIRLPPDGPPGRLWFNGDVLLLDCGGRSWDRKTKAQGMSKP